jgi:NAD(P)-dependent dehydrogenase (short-subunit alcohol dehydrogenase family)
MILAGKVALVTGGSRGIGRAVALKLADLGAAIAINFFKSRQKASQTQHEIINEGQECATFRANMNDTDSVRKLFHDVKAKFGKIDILVANAAMAMFGDLENFSLKGWEVTMDANARAYFLCAQEAYKIMPPGGKIVALTSYGSQKYIPGYAALGSAKAAIETLTKYLAVEFAAKDINVNCVSGGAVDTDSLRILSEYNKEIALEYVRKTPAKRLGRPEDIANVVAFLCTPEADWVRGQTIIADGGFSLM